MSGTTTPSAESPEPAKKKRGPRPRPKPEDGSRDAKRIAAVVLEVLAGARSPQDAADALAVSLPSYYIAENRAIAGLVSACEPTARYSQHSTEVELATMKKENERLQRDLARHQALSRVAQRTIGLPPPSKDDKSKKKRSPRIRALRAVAQLRKNIATDASEMTGTKSDNP